MVTGCTGIPGDLTPEGSRIVRRLLGQLDELDALPGRGSARHQIVLALVDALVAGVRLGHSEAVAQVIEQLRTTAPNVRVEARLHSDGGLRGFLERELDEHRNRQAPTD